MTAKRLLNSAFSGAGLFFTLLLAGCSGEKQAEEHQGLQLLGGDEAARSEVERGPVKLTVEVKPKKARLSDEPVLTLVIEAEQGVKVNKPPFGESLGAFIIRDYHESLPEIRDGRRIIRQTYTLEPTGTGEFSIYPVRMTFVDERPDGDGKEHTIESEGLVIEIASALATDAPSLADLRPPTGPVEIPENRKAWWWWPLGGAAILAGTLIAVLVLRKKRVVSLEKKLTPKEIAFLEFKKLLEAGLLDTDIKLFYVELTGIVRRFIERTTGIRAPEQTTEEFLRETSRTTVFPEDERERLKQFLESADLVKFAAFTPGKREIEESFLRAKAFIGLIDLPSEEAAA